MSVHAAFERLVDRAIVWGHLPTSYAFDFDPQLGPGFLATGKPEPCETVPEPTQYNTPDMPMDAIGCKPQPGVAYVFVEGQGWELSEPTPERQIERPTKAEYIHAFQRQAETTGQLPPECVRQTWAASNGTVGDYMEDYDSMPRSARRALDQYRPFDLSCAYDRGLIGRIEWYCQRHDKRAYAAKYLVTN